MKWDESKEEFWTVRKKIIVEKEFEVWVNYIRHDKMYDSEQELRLESVKEVF